METCECAARIPGGLAALLHFHRGTRHAAARASGTRHRVPTLGDARIAAVRSSANAVAECPLRQIAGMFRSPAEELRKP